MPQEENIMLFSRGQFIFLINFKFCRRVLGWVGLLSRPVAQVTIFRQIHQENVASKFWHSVNSIQRQHSQPDTFSTFANRSAQLHRAQRRHRNKRSDEFDRPLPNAPVPNSCSIAAMKVLSRDSMEHSEPISKQKVAGSRAPYEISIKIPEVHSDDWTKGVIDAPLARARKKELQPRITVPCLYGRRIKFIARVVLEEETFQLGRRYETEEEARFHAANLAGALLLHHHAFINAASTPSFPTSCMTQWVPILV
jgi:hypothetical protein